MQISRCFFSRKALGIGACLLALTPLMAVAGQGDNGPFTIRMKFKSGEVNRYQTNMQLTLGGLNMGGKSGSPAPASATPLQAVTVVQQFKVTKLLPNGGAQVEATTISTQGNLAGQPMNLQNSTPPVMIGLDSRGNVTSQQVPGNTVPGGGMLGNLLGTGAMGMQGLSLPDKSVRPGDFWVQKIAIPKIGTAVMKGSFVSVQKIGRYRVARIHTTLNMPIHTGMDAAMKPTAKPAVATATLSGVMTMSYDSDFALDAGKLIRTSGSGTAAIELARAGMPQKTGGPNAAPAVPPMKMNVKIAVGSSLME